MKFIKWTRITLLASALMASSFSALNAQSMFDHYIASREGVSPDVAREVMNPSGKAPRYVMPKSDKPRHSLGEDLYTEYKEYLEVLEKEYGVGPEVIMGIWGVETHFGQNVGNEPVGKALVTFLAKRPDRSDFIRNELAATMRLAQKGLVKPEDMVGSWAGAMGQTQFMPSSIEKFAVDGDGDGEIDMWSTRDALASTANYLHKNGWHRDQSWGLAVHVPGDIYSKANEGEWHDMEFWRENHVVPEYGISGMSKEGKAKLKYYKGQNFLLYPNFDVILTYNNSTDYAFEVASLGDVVVDPERYGTLEISKLVDGVDKAPDDAPAPPNADGNNSGGAAPKAASCSSEVCRVQKILKAKGYYSGPIDGVAGKGLAKAIAKFQLANGLPVDGRITKLLTSKLR